jgi:hypothetical protein
MGISIQSVLRGSVVVALLAAPWWIPATAQSHGVGDSLGPMHFFLGQWEGTSEGSPGKGTVRREYTRMFGTRFVQAKNHSVYPPQEKNPKGESHEDFGIYSLDTTRKRIVFRQFHGEGFVNQYVQDEPGKLAFTSESIENIPAGYRARETYVVIDSNQFEEIFEMAAPGKAFEVYSRTRLKRIP